MCLCFLRGSLVFVSAQPVSQSVECSNFLHKECVQNSWRELQSLTQRSRGRSTQKAQNNNANSVYRYNIYIYQQVDEEHYAARTKKTDEE